MRDQAGRFLPGPDPDRHQLTRRERQKGYRRLLAGGKKNQLTHDVIAWVWRRVRSYYRARKRQDLAGDQAGN